MIRPKGPVLYILDRYPELSQTFVRNEILELRRQGVPVLVAALRPGGDFSVSERPDWTLDDIDLFRGSVLLLRLLIRHPRRVTRFLSRLVGMRKSYARVAVGAIPQLIFAVRHDGVVRVHSHFAWGASAVATYAGALLGVPVSLTVHARDIFVHPRSLECKFASTDVVVTVCEYSRTWLDNHGYRPNRVAMVPCGVEVPARPPAPQAPTVVAVGRLVPKKGMDQLIRAAAKVRHSVPELRVDIVGEGQERALLEALIDDLGLRDTVWLRGAQPHVESLAIIAAAKLFVLPCLHDVDGDSDALPVVIREAMARAVPVVSTTVAGIPETVTDETGWLVPPGDVDALSDAMIAAMSDEPERIRRGNAARDRMAELYTLPRTVAQLRTILALD